MSEVSVAAHIRLEALNIASRETVARSYENMHTTEIARQMVEFVEGTEATLSVKELVEWLDEQAKSRFAVGGTEDPRGETLLGLAHYLREAGTLPHDVDQKAPIGSIDPSHESDSERWRITLEQIANDKNLSWMEAVEKAQAALSTSALRKGERPV